MAFVTKNVLQRRAGIEAARAYLAGRDARRAAQQRTRTAIGLVIVLVCIIIGGSYAIR